MKNNTPLIFGEVLFDVFPDGSRVLGGAPFNVAWHCHAFGLNPLFLSRVGNDVLGNEIEHAMAEWGMRTDGLQIDNEHQTGVVRVTFSGDEPAYDIVEHSAWDYIDFNELPVIDNHSLLYHGSLSMRNDVSHDCLFALKQHFPDSIFVDVNLRTPWYSLEKVGNLLQAAQWIKLNMDELDLIVSQGDDIADKVSILMSESVYEFIIITKGSDGAVAFDNTGVYTVKPKPAIKLVDTVGAGDAFTSVLLLGIHKGWPLHQVISCGQEFASEIVGLKGATIQDRDFYKPFINDWKL